MQPLSKLTRELSCPPASPLLSRLRHFSLPQIYDMLPEDQQVQRQRRVQHTEAVIAGTGADSMRAGLCEWSGTVVLDPPTGLKSQSVND